MTSDKSQSEIMDLFWSLQDGSARPEDVERLEQLARQSPEIRRSFARFAAICGLIEWQRRAAGAAENDGCAMLNDHCRAAKQPAEPAPSLHPSSFILHSFPFAGALVSYVCAAMIFAGGLAAAHLWGPAAGSQQVVQDAASTPLQAGNSTDLFAAGTVPDASLSLDIAPTAGPVIVGKITGTSNCQWAHPSLAAGAGDPVPLGRKYPITAGLLEITYDSGAKVIVQGPAIYSASSYNGGGLYFGKLTASAGKLDRAKLISAERAMGHVPPSPTVAAFCVHTPSAVVTDQGNQAAQFGVEVDRSKATFTRVLQGSINVGAQGFQGPYPVAAGTCVWTGAGGRHDGLLIFKPGPETAIFATKMPKPPPFCLTQPTANEAGWSARRPGG